jgi:predicted PurR-regulated permease PerM
MKHEHAERYFLLALLVGAVVVAFFLFKPFLYALVLALVLATVCAPVYRSFLRLTGGWRGMAAFFSMLAVLLIIVVPVALIASQILQEASQMYVYLVSEPGNYALTTSIDYLTSHVARWLPIQFEPSSVDVSGYAQEALTWLLAHLGIFASNAVRVGINIFIFLLALYYAFKDGSRLKKAVITLSPLQDIHDEQIFSKLNSAVNAVIRGNLVIAIIQGALTAVGFAIFGIPNIVLWGSVAMVAALIPGLGTALVLGPAIFFLILSQSYVAALGLSVWGIVAVGLIDNFLSPRLVQRGIRIHPFLILLSILGGLTFFGPLGFLLGPLALSLLFALLEIYFSLQREVVA